MRWIDFKGVTLDKARCEQIADWAQSSSTFVALRVPVLAAAPGNQSFILPVLFPRATEADFKKPRLQLHGYEPLPVKKDLITPIPLELRPERMTFAENELPSASGEQWVTMGAALTPQTDCPDGLNYTNWSYQITVPTDLVGKGTEIPIYFCQEGQNPPPFAPAAFQAAGQGSKVKKTLAVQAAGITCLGPQNHSLLTSSTIQLDSPAIAWNIQPSKVVNMRNEVLIFGPRPINLRFTINSQLTGVSWALYEGNQTQTAPDTFKPITSPFTINSFLTQFWMVGTIPQGTASGSYNIILTAEKDGDPTITSSLTNIIWVGDWVPPPTALTGNLLFLPLLQKQ